MGRLDAAEELSAEAVALAETTDFLVVRADALADRAEVLFAADRAEEGEEASQQAFSLYEQKGAVAAEERARRHLSLERGTPSHPDG
jgi:hypothetical protein